MIRDFFFAPNVRRHAGRLHHQHEYTSCSGIGGRAIREHAQKCRCWRSRSDFFGH